jgi:hypothetical protein
VLEAVEDCADKEPNSLLPHGRVLLYAPFPIFSGCSRTAGERVSREWLDNQGRNPNANQAQHDEGFSMVNDDQDVPATRSGIVG